jgi:predicted phosphodiesterase
MVKSGIGKIIFFLPIAVFLFTAGCNIDLLGLFLSNDLEERLRSKDTFNFLKPEELNTSFGSEYSFMVLTDTHIENGNTWGLENIAPVAEDAANNIKFIVFLGDITQTGSAQDIQTFIDFANTLSMPVYPVIGNHDIYFNNWNVYRDKIGSTRYKVKGGGTTLFILDSANSFFGKEQLDWLEMELRSLNANERVFVFTHSALLIEGPLRIQQLTDTRERARIKSILQDRCDIMFMGHSHRRLIYTAGNVKYINIEDFKKTRTYCIVTVTPSGITYRFEQLPD